MEAGKFLNLQMEAILAQLKIALEPCSQERYVMPLPMLSGASIGEHTRHIVEFFQCIKDTHEKDFVDYSLRARESSIETDKDFALDHLSEVIHFLNLPNKEIFLYLDTGLSADLVISSNLYREIAYNIEHAIHHMAIIKIGLTSLGITVADDFGVAESTLQYRASCAS